MKSEFYLMEFTISRKPTLAQAKKADLGKIK